MKIGGGHTTLWSRSDALEKGFRTIRVRKPVNDVQIWRDEFQKSGVESPWNKSARHGEDCRMRCLMNSRVSCSRPYGDGEKNESGKNAAKELCVRFHMHGSGFPCFTNFIVKAYSLTMHVCHCHC